MQLVQEGDTAQLAVLFERHHMALFQHLLALTRNRAASEDLVQEAFFRVIKYARTYNPGLSFPTWLHGIARNAYFDSLRKRRAETPMEPLVAAEMKSSTPAPEELLSRKQDSAFLQNALDQLPADKREVLVLSRFHNLRYEDIARILECEVGTVKVRVYRALKELRARFCELRGEKVYDA
jgi:RNA polymerase sigma-70 factor (ECF subfamily)